MIPDIGTYLRGLAVIAVLGMLASLTWCSYDYGRNFERQAAIIEAGKRIQNLEKNNGAFNALPARERCLAFMRDSGLPAAFCDER